MDHSLAKNSRIACNFKASLHTRYCLPPHISESTVSFALANSIAHCRMSFGMQVNPSCSVISSREVEPSRLGAQNPATRFLDNIELKV